MKLVTFRTESEGVRHGVLRGDAQTGSVVDLGPGDLLSLIDAGPSGLERAREAKGREMDVGSVRLLAPLRRPPKLLALARNYQDHITEGGGQPVDKQRVVPKLFLKPSSAIIGPDEPLCLPSVSNTTDWEVELAVVIGRRGRNVSMSDALQMVFGYTIANDVSARTTEWGVERDPDVWNDFFDWLCGKWPDGFAPLGPYVLTADEVPDPQTLDLSPVPQRRAQAELEHPRDDLHGGRDDRVRLTFHDARAGRHHRDWHAVGRRRDDRHLRKVG